MIITTTIAKLTTQDVADYHVHLSREQLLTIINGMTNCAVTNVAKIDKPAQHWEIVQALRDLSGIKPINRRD